ncbi:MAG: GDYXXLXY domain-containing protein, partial [Planctomycetaceae bacterium]|nr:GDYXXLXY domain-containing protein [Planctomycetaceae bacterium]
DGAFFFAGIMYGVGIGVVGQVFHMPADFPMFMWLWAFGAFLLALVLASTPLHLLSVALFAIWVCAKLPEPNMFVYGLVPDAAWSLPIFAALGISAAALKQNRFVVLLYSLLLVLWGILLGPSCTPDLHVTFHVTTVGLIVLAVSAGMSKSTNGIVLRYVGILLTFAGLIAPSYLECWESLLYWKFWVHNSSWKGANPNVLLAWAFALPVIDFLVLFCLFRWRTRKERLDDYVQRNILLYCAVILWLALLATLWIGSEFILLVSSGTSVYSYHRRFSDPLVLGGMVTVNVLFVWLAVGLMIGGLKQNRGSLFWSGTLFFLFWAILRYFDLFSEFGGMLGTAAIFLFCGLFMFGIVYFWTTRRKKFLTTQPVAESPAEFTIPLWLQAVGEKISRLWLSERRILTAAMGVALLQFGVLGAMIANEMVPHVYGTTIRVTTVPVDPRDLFRGDYVVLRYEFSNSSSIPGYHDGNNSPSRTVFVTMKQEGDLWKADGFSYTRPKEGIFLRGTLHYNTIKYGIESYFVQEGKGKAIEDAMRWETIPRDQESVIVELTVAPNGKAAIKTVLRSEPQS